MRETPSYKRNPGQEKLNKILRLDDIIRILAISGARSGKTFEFIRALISRSIHAAESRHAIIRRHFSEAKKFIWLDTLPKVIKLCYPQLIGKIRENKSDFYYKFPNDSEIWIGGLDDKERSDKILGGEYNTIYFNEVSEISYSSIEIALTRLAMKTYKNDGKLLVNKAYFDENPPLRSHWSHKVWYEHLDPVTRDSIKNPGKYKHIRLHPSDNIENLPAEYIESLKNLTGAARKRFYEGIFQDEIQGALWNENMINKYRVVNYPDLQRIVIPIDPAITSNEDSNETGIVPVGLGTDGHIYVLGDLSGVYTPNEWGSTSILAYDKWQADAIVGEVNQGGDMVEAIVHNIRNEVNFKEVRATRGKITRAEPVAALYERGLVHHVGSFVDLEYQLCTYTGKEKSPDRLDSLVWGITELTMIEATDEIVVYYDPVNISPI